MHRSKIEWVLNPDNKTLGWVWNPITGCLNHNNGMCKGGNFPCYAYKLAHGRLRERYLNNSIIAPTKTQPFDKPYNPLLDSFYPRFWPERLRELQQLNIALIEQGEVRPPRGIFVCDMGELFGDWLPLEWTEAVLNEIDNKYDRFYLPTKQPQNLIKFSPFPDNCWVGVTATDHIMFAAAYYYLSAIEAKVKYISIEPLLNWDARLTLPMMYQGSHAGFNWVIIGACTGQPKELMTLQIKYPDLEPIRYGKKLTLQPKIEWVREIIEAADRAGIPVFLKDNLEPLLINNKGFGNVSVGTLIERKIETGGYKLRQEMPK